MTAKTAGESQAGKILVGPAGWSYSDWNGVLYPAPRPRDFHEAEYLAEFFDTIEINTSFYQPLRPEIATQWLGYIAGNRQFLFTAKLWQKFTHEGSNTGNGRACRVPGSVRYCSSTATSSAASSRQRSSPTTT